MLDIFVGFSIVVMFATMIFTFIAKKRMDRNEPIFGWKRKQFLEERNGNVSTVDNSEAKTRTGKKIAKKVDPDEDLISDLVGVEKVEYGVIHKKNNEFCIILSSDFVNFDLLKRTEQIGILQGYQQLFNVVNFDISLLAQAVRQDFRKDRARFEENLKKCNPQTVNYNMDVIEYIQSRTMNDFRITLKIYYVINFVYEPSKMAKLSKEQREISIVESLYQRANIVRRALRRAKVEAEVLDSLHAIEVLKRAMNRDRMVFHPIEELADKEKMAPFITMDPSSIEGFENLVHDVEEAMEIVKAG
ncbi:hypothetical protein [Viridibacillus arvi]|uniref:hypothetical protein n=1 Tax=Viridibacillus arvi TaxID=263475 RepID=UPI0034CD4C91